MPDPEPLATVIRPRRAALGFAAIVAAVSLVLLGIGVRDLVSQFTLVAPALVLAGAYGLWQVARTPFELRVADGQVTVRALGGGSVPVADLARVELARQSVLRPQVLRFVRQDGTVAFATDAGPWEPSQLKQLLDGLGVPLVAPGQPPRSGSPPSGSPPSQPPPGQRRGKQRRR
ncbi:MAG TPA: hypothetical protein VFA92_03650 [Candidatus Binatia bacterium]|nr:hypothetical protein [Candidatus Binatia bacterium]